MKRLQSLIALLVLATAFNLGQPFPAQANPIQKPDQPQSKAPRNLAILIFDGVQIIDYTGPFETFGHVFSDDGPAFNMYTVSEKTNAITTAMGMSVNPKYNFENAPEPDVLLIPGGSVKGQVENANTIKWIQEKSKRAEIVMSVCNGAYILAKAGLLDGLEATTTSGLIPGLRIAAPRTKVVDDKRFVDNGKIITTAGLSSGIDGSLHVIERLFGKGTAQLAALGMEYNWDPDSKFVRAALADKYMRFNYDVKTLAGGWLPLSRNGGRDQWENKWSVTTESSATEIFESVNNTIANNKVYGEPSEITKWTRTNDAPKGATQSWWHFTDEKGMVWNGEVSVMPSAGMQKQFTLSVKIARNTTSAKSAAN
ncbi:MAG TPA: DJ-1/PfpI family protein [Pyrinomonadaceae bacterium]|jgi:putative intracellular protease/amidase|nr:DJ-1/PfpI family protein [Pyrinomonadaceae bacterium]